MNDELFLRPLAKAFLAMTAIFLFGGGAIALLASNESWRTAGAGFALFGTPISLIYVGVVWLIDRIMG